MRLWFQIFSCETLFAHFVSRFHSFLFLPLFFSLSFGFRFTSLAVIIVPYDWCSSLPKYEPQTDSILQPRPSFSNGRKMSEISASIGNPITGERQTDVFMPYFSFFYIALRKEGMFALFVSLKRRKLHCKIKGRLWNRLKNRLIGQWKVFHYVFALFL